MKDYHKKFLSVFSITLLLITSCSKSKNELNPDVNVTIKSLDINNGRYNTSVTISGTGFSSAIAEDKVMFNGKIATIKTATSTSIVAIVPAGAGTGPVSVSINGGQIISGPIFTYELTATVTTYAGSGTAASVDGTGISASFYGPGGLAGDAAGNLYVTDYFSCTVRKISPGVKVTTLAGSGQPGLADGTGPAASFRWPGAITLDASNNIYLADEQNDVIRKITQAGVVTTIAGNASGGYVDDKGANAGFLFPSGIVLDASGNIFIGDAGNNAIRKITPDFTVTTFAGRGPLYPGTTNGTGTNATFFEPSGEVFDAAGNLYVLDSSGLIRKITPNAVVTTFAGGNRAGRALDGKGDAASFFLPVGIAVDAAGNFYIADAGNNLIRKVTADGVVTTIAGSGKAAAEDGIGKNASFNNPTGIIVDKSGTIYVADCGNNLIRKIVMQ